MFDIQDYAYVDTTVIQTDTIITMSEIEVEITSVNDPSSLEVKPGEYILTDDFISNSTVDLSFQLQVKGNVGELTKEQVFSSIFLQWSSLSEDQYAFEESYARYLDSQSFGPFAEAVVIYSNVENGLGYLGAESIQVLNLECD